MEEYAESAACRMAYLRGALNDPLAEPCGICDRCGGEFAWARVDDEDIATARKFLRSRPLPIEPRHNWPTGLSDVRGRIPVDEQCEMGLALSRWGDGGWGREVAQAKEKGSFPGELVEALVAMLRDHPPAPSPAWVTCVPSRRQASLVDDAARGVASLLGLPFEAVVSKSVESRPQKEMENSANQVRNVLPAFTVTGPVRAGPVLLIDDVVDSRWTFTVIARLLRQAGAGPVIPVAFANASGS
jgi:ATP-dependent DNA helicase RecQ